jgi:hypothetical protein
MKTIALKNFRQKAPRATLPINGVQGEEAIERQRGFLANLTKTDRESL